MKIRTGIDLGGTKIEVMSLGPNDEILFQQRTTTPKGEYQQTLHKIRDLVNSADKHLGTKTSIGIGTPGAISKSKQTIKNANSTCLNGQPLHSDLNQLLGREIRISNDANCFVLSEALDGAAKTYDNVFGVIIGTGTGGGLVFNKQIVNGCNSIGGEWGHNPLPWPDPSELPGPACYCGKFGCIETFISGPGMETDYQNHNQSQTIRCEKIIELVQQKHNAAEQCLLRYERRLAKSLAHVINIVDPDIVVLGGGLSNIKRLYENIPKIWHEYIFSDEIATKLVPAKYGDASGVRGAAKLWKLEELSESQ